MKQENRVGGRMDDNLQRGILLVVTILIVIGFTFDLWTDNGEGTDAPASPLLVFNP